MVGARVLGVGLLAAGCASSAPSPAPAPAGEGLRGRVERLRREQDALFASGLAPLELVEKVPAPQRGDAAGSYLRGRALARAGRFEEGAFEFEASIAADPHLPHPHAGLGAIDLEQGRVAAAIARFRRALSLDPSFHEARYELVRALDAAGDREGAKREAEELLRRDEDPIRAPLWLAGRASEEGRPEEALPILRGVLEHDPGNAPVRIRLAQALLASGRLEEAAAEVDSLLSSGKLDPAVLYELAGLYRRAGRLERAAALLERASAEATPAFLARVPRAQLDSSLREVREELASGRRTVSAQDLLAVLRGDPSPERRTEALAILCQAEVPGLSRVLEEALKDPAPPVRALAAREAGVRSRALAAEALPALLRSDPDARVRAATCEGLARWRVEGALPDLVSAMGEKELPLADAACRAVEAIAERAFFLGDPSSTDPAPREEAARRARRWLETRSPGEGGPR
ncbi:MAG TPA: tetratricopeptide repeat protein [Planctomycetota bacterium]|nr:tetratricopeptide repeat protein [Planctomycetota bacterium]